MTDQTRLYGRMQSRGKWAPAYRDPGGLWWISRPAGWPWTQPTGAERATFQARLDQSTVGRIWDDSRYDTTDQSKETTA